MTIVLRTLPEYAAEVPVHRVLQLLDPSVSLGALLPLVSKSRMQANKTLHQTEIVTGAGLVKSERIETRLQVAALPSSRLTAFSDDLPVSIETRGSAWGIELCNPIRSPFLASLLSTSCPLSVHLPPPPVSLLSTSCPPPLCHYHKNSSPYQENILDPLASIYSLCHVPMIPTAPSVQLMLCPPEHPLNTS